MFFFPIILIGFFSHSIPYIPVMNLDASWETILDEQLCEFTVISELNTIIILYSAINKTFPFLFCLFCFDVFCFVSIENPVVLIF